MADIDTLGRFIAAMPGDEAVISKASLIAIEQELRENRAALAMARAGDAIGCIAEKLGKRATR